MLNAVQGAIANAGVFFVSGDVDVWKTFRLSDVAVFVDRYKSLFHSYLLERRKSCETCYLECNSAKRSSRDSQVGSSTDSGSSTSSVVSSKKVKGVSPKSVAKNVPESASSSMTASKPCGSSKKDGGDSIAVTKAKKNSERGNPDPTVHHKIGKLNIVSQLTVTLYICIYDLVISSCCISSGHVSCPFFGLVASEFLKNLTLPLQFGLVC